MEKTILQIPISKQLRLEAEKAALEEGFSSLQEGVRIFLKKLAKGLLRVSFEEYPVYDLSRRALKKIEKAQLDHKRGKTVILRSINDLDNL